MKRYKEAVKYLETTLMKEDSAIGHFMLATAYHFLQNELTGEDCGEYPLNWGNQEKGIYHISKYRDMGGVPEIDEKKFDILLGLLFASKNRKIFETPLRYLVFGDEEEVRSRFSIK